MPARPVARGRELGWAGVASLAEFGRLQAQVRQDGAEAGEPTTVTGPSVNAGEWHHFVLIRQAGEAIGHLLGQEHEADGLMADTLTVDSRHVPWSDAYWTDLATALSPGDVPSEATTWPDPISAWNRRNSLGNGRLVFLRADERCAEDRRE